MWTKTAGIVLAVPPVSSGGCSLPCGQAVGNQGSGFIINHRHDSIINAWGK